jgi:bifunctional non-homologous end joining protein LigD
VFSRHGNDYSDRVPAITDALQSLKVKSVTLDGEGVVCDPDGVTDFDLLRAALGRKGSRRAFLYAFDVLELDGRDLRDRPLGGSAEGPNEAPAQSVAGVRLSDHLATTDGDTLFHHACAMGLEGIVAKRRDRPYRSGRSPDWVKVKNPDAPAATRVIEG